MSNQRKFFSNFLFLIIVNLFIKPFWIFGIDRVVQNRSQVEEYGVYFSLFNLSLIFSILLDFGINNFNNRAVSRSPHRIGTYFTNLLFLKIFISLIYLSILLAYAYLSHFSTLKLSHLFLLAINQVLLSFILYFRSNLTALQAFKTDSFLSVLDKLLATIFCGMLLYFPHFIFKFCLTNFILSQTLALSVTCFFAFLFTFKKIKIQIYWWKIRFFKSILLHALPFALIGLLMSIYHRIDAIMLENMRGGAETGIYAAAYRLLDAINQIGYLVGIPLLPIFAKMIKQKESISSLLNFSASGIFFVSFSVAIVSFFFQNPLIHLLYLHATPAYATVFGWLMISFIPMSSIYVFGTLLTAKGEVWLINKIALVCIAINVLLNFIWIPSQGALGTTLATLCTQLVAAILHIYFIQKILKPTWTALNFYKIFGWILVATLFVFICSKNIANFYLAISIASFGLVLSLFIFQILDLKSISQTVLNRKD